MTETPVTQVTNDPNFMLILIGAIIWMLGMYNLLFIGPFLSVIGFAMTASAIAISSLKRPTDKAVVGLLIGGVIQLVGYYIIWVPFIGWFIYPPLVVLGGVMILFFAIPLALQTGKVPFIEELQAQLKRDDTPEEPTETPDDETTGE
ncbi:MAG: hypothetical protein ACTSV2_03415 [Candidatus Thorarchaeota archaeon]